MGFQSWVKNALAKTLSWGDIRLMMGGGVQADSVNLRVVDGPDAITGHLAVPQVFDLAKMCLSRIVADVSRVDCQVVRETSGGDDVVIDDHPLLSILYNNPAGHNYNEIIGLTVGYMIQGGTAYWILEPYSSLGRKLKPTSIRVIRPDHMLPMVDADGKVEEYRYSPSKKFAEKGAYAIYPAAAVVSFKIPSIHSQIYGEPVLQGYQVRVNTELARQVYQDRFFRNGGIPGVVAVMEGQTKPEELTRLAELWEKKFSGPGNSHRLGFIGGNVKDIKLLQTTQKDMDFVNLAKMSLEDFCAAYGVPRVLFGYSDGINRANADAEERFYWQNRVMTVLSLVADEISHAVLPLWPGGEKQYARFDYNSVPALQKDKVALSTVARSWWDMGTPLTEVIKYLDVPITLGPGQDKGYLPFGVQPIEQAGIPRGISGGIEPLPLSDDEDGDDEAQTRAIKKKV